MTYPSSMSPLQAYYQKIFEKILQPDTCQEIAMQQLQRIYLSLLSRKKWTVLKKKKTTKGLYLWGEVGRGKTQLMDLFYNHLPIPKLRMHFYQLMYDVHRTLTRLQGRINPVDCVAEDLANRAKVICLDEFLVHEIADAVLLSQLLYALFQRDIILVTTANTSPDALYSTGLQRELFLPAIEQLKQHLTIFHLDSPRDYRLCYGAEKNNAIDSPVLTMTQQKVQALFNRLNKTVSYQPLSINGRLIPHNGYTEDTVWFNFSSICAVPRSQIDYLAISKIFSTVLISGIEPIAEHNDNQARLFIHLVDLFYDAGTKLILTSELSIGELYPKGRLLFEFKRAKSRLMAFKKQALSFVNDTSIQ
jgi:cell division protein ZapE